MRRKIIAIGVLLAACMSAYGGDLTISYTAPTTCAGGEPIVGCPTTGFEISKGAALAGTYAVVETVAPTVLSKRYTNLAPGTYCYYVKTVSNSQKSAESNRACADVPFLPPKAPQGMTIKIEVTVSSDP